MLCHLLAFAVLAGVVVRELERADAYVAAAPTPTPSPTPTPTADADAGSRRHATADPCRRPGLAVGVTELNANLISTPASARPARAVVGGARRARGDQARRSSGS